MKDPVGTKRISSQVRKADVNDFTNDYLIAIVSTRKEEHKMPRQWTSGSLASYWSRVGGAPGQKRRETL